ncbi:uncharacterized protein FA14DRAFT_179310 [Meira miltonrushii]|uniref:Ricin B lectin domain-containing protein n=1 Tax=Meira miltonrushii TaxID=1280837 RepID=A0A316VHX4_9BASI|nr:uncharacterized protein FA14DRAFT_179310 [Meira miltonrushii]PWN35943.1 hypothetical protein FA14DRAFT_179310 [Meira miltonrushii]
MLSLKLTRATMAIFVVAILVSPVVQAGISVDKTEKVPNKLQKGQGAITIDGDASQVAISASHQTPETSAVCHGTINQNSQMYEGPCILDTQNQQQTFHAQCVKGSGAASIVFHKEGQKGNTVDVFSVNGMQAGFGGKSHLKQGSISTKKHGVKVVLNCDKSDPSSNNKNQKSGSFSFFGGGNSDGKGDPQNSQKSGSFPFFGGSSTNNNNNNDDDSKSQSMSNFMPHF